MIHASNILAVSPPNRTRQRNHAMAMTPEHDDAAIQQAAKKTAEGLLSGRPRTSVANDLAADGWSEDDANELVLGVEEAILEDADESDADESDDNGGGIGGWVTWIGVLVVINFLSWTFDWPFWIY